MRTMERLTTLVLVAVLVLTGGLMSAAAQGEPTRVTLGFAGLNEEWREVVQREFVDTFNAAHPDIVLEVVYLETADALRTAVQAGQGPDIITTPAPSTSNQFAAAGFLAPLDDYAAKYGWREEMLPAFYRHGLL